MTDNGSAPSVPPHPMPGPETMALKRFYRNYTWTGRVKAGAMLPGSPEMPGEGTGTCTWIMDGLWVVCDFEQRTGSGDQMTTWKYYWVTGWDYGIGEYRAALFDNNGNATVFTSTIEGDTLTMESISDITAMGQSIKVRVIWDVTDPENVAWRNERSVNGGPWVVCEEYVMTPSE